ncbi:MAG: zinc-ribbon and DUF3426 domain-containing protein [Pseudomonadota bacterium]
MYTRCTHCDTWLKISVDQLRTGHGQVRCGACTDVFNALVNLTEAEPTLPDPLDLPTLEQVTPSPTSLPAPSIHADGYDTSERGAEADLPSPDPPGLEAAEAPIPSDVATQAASTADRDDSTEMLAPYDADRTFNDAGPVLDEDSKVPLARNDDDTSGGPHLPAFSAVPMESVAPEEWVRATESPPAPAADTPPSSADGRSTGVDSDDAGRGTHLMRGSDPEQTLSSDPEDPVEPTDEIPAAPASVRADEDGDAKGDAEAGVFDRPIFAEPDAQPVGDAADDAVARLDDPIVPGDPLVAEIPPALRADYVRLAKQRQHPAVRIGLFCIALLGLAGLPIQYAWFMSEDLVRRYPLARPYVEQFCTRAGCELEQPDDRRYIELVGRDVRVHPRFEGALQIQAAFTNAGPRAQRYPQVRFTLFNVNGDVIGARSFNAEDYLPDPRAASGHLQPGETTQIQLDLIAPEDTAVSFEFEFI